MLTDDKSPSNIRNPIETLFIFSYQLVFTHCLTFIFSGQLRLILSMINIYNFLKIAKTDIQTNLFCYLSVTQEAMAID